MGLVEFVHKIELAIIFSNLTVKMPVFFPIGERAYFAEYLLAINVSVPRQGMPIQTDRNERGVLLEDIFAEIRNAVPMQDIAKFYGLQISRSGMACCPFHDDKTPSLKIYPDHFYCFGCGESGDVTGFVAKLFHISQMEAAKKISYDFGLNLFNGELAIPIKIAPNPNAEYLLWLKKAKTAVTDYLNKLLDWREQYKPHTLSAPLHSRFCESLQKTSYIEYLNEILQYGTDNEKREMFRDNKNEIRKIQQRLEKLVADERTVKRKVI